MPEPLDEKIVPPGTLAVHADRDRGRILRIGSGPSLDEVDRKLQTLIGVDDLRPAEVGHGFVQRLQRWLGLQPDRQPPG